MWPPVHVQRMTLDPVHVDGIARLAGRVSRGVDDTDQQNVAERVWNDFLDPLYDDGTPVLEPLGEQARKAADVEDIALQESPFPIQHGIDSGTINPTTFKNGVVLDVSQAAMSAVPTDLDLHRARTIVMTAHSNDDAFTVRNDDWSMDDEGYVRKRVLHAPRVDRYEQNVVHALALYLAESTHALTQADVVDDLLILDGPLYPTGLLRWAAHSKELSDLLEESEQPRTVVQNYVELVERFVERDVPLVGFVKNNTAKGLTLAVRKKSNAPWGNDAGFFSRVLERRDDDGELLTDALTFTNWFRSRVGTDRFLSTVGDHLGFENDEDFTFELDRENYEVTFFVVYDPRDDLIYRVEAPYAFTKDEGIREQLTMQILTDVAAERGPPLAVGKADELAHIDQQAKAQLRRGIERQFDTERQREYNDKRWGVEFEDL
jgi:hypothetical protein